MDELEKTIKGFHNILQADEPAEGHFERFEMKLNAATQNKTLKWWKYWPGVAAILIIALVVFIPKQQKNRTITLGGLSEQYAQVEYYYTSNIKQQTHKINQLNRQSDNDPIVKMLVNELEQYDIVYEQLCSDLNATPNDERVINALINFYKTKLEITARILESIEQKTIKIDKNEDFEI